MSFGFGFGLPRAPLRGRPLVAAIRALFANGEQGVWYDPSDFSTMFQDADGTVPVTGVEQPVGLMLDKSRGGRGPNLTPPTDQLSGWTVAANNTLSIDGNAVVSTNTTNTRVALRVPDIVTPGVYEVEIDLEAAISSTGTTTLRVAFSASTGFAGSLTFPQPMTAIPGTGRHQRRAIVTVTDPAHSGLLVGTNAASEILAGSWIKLHSVSVRRVDGNHASQPTATSRPVLSARVNLLTKTEDFTHSDWSSAITPFVDGPVIAPDGTNTAFRFSGKEGVSSTPNRLLVTQSGNVVFSLFLRHISGGASNINALVRNTTSATNLVSVNLGQAESGTSSYGNWEKIAVGNDWFKVIIYVTSGLNPNDSVSLYFGRTNTPAVGQVWDVWHPDFRPANTGVNLPPYQRVNTATDYDTVGFPYYLYFDGVDDWMVTNTITPGIDKAQVFAGGSKNSDIAFPVLVENSTDPSANNGTFSLSPRQGGATEGATFRTKGTIQSIVNMLGLVAPTKFVLTGIGSISEDVVALRSGGAEVIRGLADQGTGDFGEYPIYIGSRAGTSLRFNGHLYSLIVRFGSNLSIATIEKIEKYINGKTRAY